MFDDLFTIKKELSTYNVRQSLQNKGYNDIDLCSYYIPSFQKVGKSFRSDLRYDDKNASMTTSWSNSGNVIISDFGYKTGMSVFGYIQEKYYDNSKIGYIRALDRVCVDFNLNDIIASSYRKTLSKPSKKPLKYNISTKIKQPVTIKKRARKFNDLDEEFWTYGFGISLNILKSKKIEAISSFQVINPNKDSNMLIILKPRELGYCYPEWKNGKAYYKIYLPYGHNGDREFKWFSNISNDIIFNLRFIPQDYNDLLIIQSSYKDCMVMESFGYKSIPLNGEGMWFLDKQWNYIKNRFKRIIYFGDNDWEKKDNPGIMLCNKWKDKYGVEFIHTPDNTKSDISDYYKEYGYSKTKLLLKELI